MNNALSLHIAAVRRLGGTAFLLFGCALMSAAADTTRVTVMTRNMDAGTDFGFVFGAATLPALMQGAQATLAEIDASRIPERAAGIAAEIAAHRPDLVALQEVTQYWTRTPDGAPVLRYDQLQALLDGLAARNLSYSPVVVNPLMMAEAPLTPDLLFGTMDRDVILVRAGIATAQPQAHRFSDGATFTLPTPLGDVPLWQGWSSVDITVAGKTFRFVNTHLQSAFKGVPPTLAAQVAQAGELVQALNATYLPVVLCGDFNANADPGEEHYPTTDMVLAAGFTDAWRATNADKGNTWPLHQEDPFLPMAGPYERIDLIFARGPIVVGTERSDAPARRQPGSGLGVPGLWPSDHAGVIAVLEPL